MEDPELLSRPHVVATHVAGRHLLQGRHGVVRDVADQRTDHDDVFDDERRRAPTEALDDPVVVPLCQVDSAAAAEVRVAGAGPRVQRDEPRSQYGQHARVVTVGPVGQPARREAPAGLLALAGRRRVEPGHLAGCRVEGRHHTETRADVEQAVGHQRRVLRSGRRGHRVALPRGVGDRRLPPGHAQAVHGFPRRSDRAVSTSCSPCRRRRRATRPPARPRKAGFRWRVPPRDRTSRNDAARKQLDSTRRASSPVNGRGRCRAPHGIEAGCPADQPAREESPLDAFQDAAPGCAHESISLLADLPANPIHRVGDYIRCGMRIRGA